MADLANAVSVWAEVLEHLKHQMTLATWRSVFSGSLAGFYDGEVLEVGLLSKNAVAWADGRLKVVVERTAGDVLRRPVRVRFSVRAGHGGNGTDPGAELATEPAEGGGGVDVGDRRRVRWYRVDNVVLDDYLPLMGIKAFAVYSLYCRMSGRDGLSWPGYDYITRTLKIGRSTVSQCNAVLEVLGLIEIDRGNSERSNRYYLLEPETLTETVLDGMWKRAEAAGIPALIAALAVVLNGDYPSPEPGPRQSSTGTAPVLNGDYPSPQPGLEQDTTNKTQEQNTGTRGPPPQAVESMSVESDAEAVAWLVEIGVRRVVADKLVSAQSRRWIVAWATYTVAQKSIKSPAAFLVKKLRGDRWPPGYDR